MKPETARELGKAALWLLIAGTFAIAILIPAITDSIVKIRNTDDNFEVISNDSKGVLLLDKRTGETTLSIPETKKAEKKAPHSSDSKE